MSSVLLIGFLILIGLILLLLEVLVIPGTSIAGIFGFAALGSAVWIVYSDYGVVYGTITLVSLLIITIVTFIFAFRSKTWNKIALNDAIDSKIDTFDGEYPAVGATGITISRLNPIGKVDVDGKEYEARSVEGYIEENMPIVVTAIEGNKLIVKRQK